MPACLLPVWLFAKFESAIAGKRAACTRRANSKLAKSNQKCVIYPDGEPLLLATFANSYLDGFWYLCQPFFRFYFTAKEVVMSLIGKQKEAKRSKKGT
jgi:hypothetical protein